MAAQATARTKCTVHVSSLAPEITKDVLYAVFIPFGEIVDIQIPLNEDGEHLLCVGRDADCRPHAERVRVY